MDKTLVLLDGNSLLFRGFFAMRSLSNSSGLPTNALYAFTQMLLTLVERYKPDLLFCAWDTHEPTFRHTAYDGYKGTRQETPNELILQGPYARRLADAFRATSLEAPGYEADDIIGTLAGKGKAAGYRVLIVTGDLDALQLVEPGVEVLTTIKGVTDTVLYDDAAVDARYGLTPAQLADYRALKGDTSDNIPGVSGIGEKTAVTLLQQFGTVEALEQQLDTVTPARVQEKLKAGLEQMRLSKHLAIIDRAVPLPANAILPPVASCPPYAPDLEAVQALFTELEFRTLLRRLPGTAAAAAATAQQTAESPESYAPAAPRSAAIVTVVADDTTATALQTAARAAQRVGVRLLTGDGGTLDTPLLGIALATDDTSVFYCPMSAATPAPNPLGGLFDDTPPPAAAPNGLALAAAKTVLEDPAIPKVTHDGRTDLTVLARHGIALQNLGFDTELAAYLLFAGQRASYPLRELAQNLAGCDVPLPLDKKERAATEAAVLQARDQATVCAAAQAVHALEEALAPRLTTDHLDTLLRELELPITPILAAMERTGLLLDSTLLGRISAEMGGKIAQLEAEIHGYAGGPFTVNSPKQLAEVLFEKLKLQSGKKTKTGYSTDAEVLEELSDQPIVAAVLQYRELSKLKSTYTDALPALVRPDTGRVHTSLNQTVAATGRLSSSNPNLQNIPIRTPIGREIRRAFIAPPGKVLLSADYSQIELRIFAHVANDTDLRAAFDSGEDIHKYTAGKIYGLAPRDVDTEMRRAAKTVNYAVLYGISDFALARQLKITQAQAKALKESYFARFPGVRLYLDQTIAFAREKGYVQTLFGRRRWIPDINSRVFNFRQASERAAANMPIQGTSADIMKKAMLLVWEELEKAKLPASLLLQVHDELLFEVEASAASELGTQVKRCMESAYALAVALEVDVKTGASWGDVTPVG